MVENTMCYFPFLYSDSRFFNAGSGAAHIARIHSQPLLPRMHVVCYDIYTHYIVMV